MKNLVIGVLSILVIVLGVSTMYLFNENKKEDIKINTAVVEKNLVEDKSIAINDLEVKDEASLVEYFDGLNAEVGEFIKEKDISSNNENILKNTFITLTDFIFYDGEIKGYKFKDLTDNCKTKIIDIYNSIDSKIESRYPNYKDSIKSNGKKVYSDIKEKSIELKEKIIENYKDYVGEEQYSITEENFDIDKEKVKETYENYKPYIEKGKETGKSIISKGIEKISDWYKEYKES